MGISYVSQLACVWIMTMACLLDEAVPSPSLLADPEDKIFGCAYQDQLYAPGDFEPSPCVLCVCDGASGHLTCAYRDCPPLNLTHSHCLRYETPPGGCCQECVEHGCLHEGHGYPRGAHVSSGPCERCYCPWQGSHVVCDHVPCRPVHCEGAVTPEGKCCPVCPQTNHRWAFQFETLTSL